MFLFRIHQDIVVQRSNGTYKALSGSNSKSFFKHYHLLVYVVNNQRLAVEKIIDEQFPLEYIIIV